MVFYAVVFRSETEGATGWLEVCQPSERSPKLGVGTQTTPAFSGLPHRIPYGRWNQLQVDGSLTDFRLSNHGPKLAKSSPCPLPVAVQIDSGEFLALNLLVGIGQPGAS